MEAVGFSRFRFHSKRTASTASASIFYLRFHIPAPNTTQDLERLLEIYQEDIGPRAAVVPEVQRWVTKWKKEDVSTVPSSSGGSW